MIRNTLAAIALLYAASAGAQTANSVTHGPRLPRSPAASRLAQAPLPRAGGQLSQLDSAGETWASLEDNDRYLLIMGSADGFAAAGRGAPCFPGMNNAQIAEKLNSAGFGSSDPRDLPAALRKVASDPAKCPIDIRRGYTMSLLKGMPDRHLATYLTGVVRAYASIKPCPVNYQQYAAAATAAAIFQAGDGDQPYLVVGPAIVAGCKGPASN